MRGCNSQEILDKLFKILPGRSLIDQLIYFPDILVQSLNIFSMIIIIHPEGYSTKAIIYYLQQRWLPPGSLPQEIWIFCPKLFFSLPSMKHNQKIMILPLHQSTPILWLLFQGIKLVKRADSSLYASFSTCYISLVHIRSVLLDTDY